MRKRLVTLLSIGIASGCCFSCSEEKARKEIPTVEIGAAMATAGEFGISEIAERLAFVALETTDRSLVGNYPDVAVWGDRIIVSSQHQPLMVFDRKDGRFLNTVGHFGDDPEGCGSDSGIIPFWIDRTNGTVYLRALGNIDLLRYDLDGNFLGRITPDVGLPEKSTLNFWFFLPSNDMVTAHNPLSMSESDRSLARFDGTDGHLLDTIAHAAPPLPPMSEVVSLSVMYGGQEPFGGAWLLQFEYRDDKAYWLAIGAPSLWMHDGRQYLKEAFVDTVYTVGKNSLAPRLALDMGEWRWPFEQRFDRAGSGKRISVDYMLENENLIYFHFHTGLYEAREEQQSHCGYFDKRSGTTQVMKGDRIADDICHFLPLSIRRVSPSGEFISLIQAADIAEWREKEKNASTPAHPAIRPVLDVDSEDNPVVVFIK
ncbi:MAG: DUF4934 domain-containing protein [Tannerella sp.]|jgi:hypothetical protein|nr:DUF4934 domain-containing protein [Tannerella sp.]